MQGGVELGAFGRAAWTSLSVWRCGDAWLSLGQPYVLKVELWSLLPVFIAWSMAISGKAIFGKAIYGKAIFGKAIYGT